MQCSMMPICAHMRFSASGNTRDRLDSRTSSVHSTPRSAGRQCRNGVGPRQVHKLLRDREALEIHAALLELVLLTHGRPYVRVDVVGPLDPRQLVRHADAADAAVVAAPERLFVGGVPWRAHHDELEREHLGKARPRVDNVVAVAHKRNLAPLDRAPVLDDRHRVRHDLAWVVVVRQPVDDGYGRVMRQVEQVGVAVQPRHHHVVVTR